MSEPTKHDEPHADHPGRWSPGLRAIGLGGLPRRWPGWEGFLSKIHDKVSPLLRHRQSVAGLAILAVGILAWWWLATHHLGGGGHEEAPAGRHGSRDVPAAAAPDFVRLPAGAAADEVSLAEAQTRRIREHLTVPGRLDYDARYRLDYASPVDGIVSQVFVKVRQRVARGDSLAEVSSPDIGTARDDVRKRQAELAIERKEADWADGIADNVAALIDSLSTHPPLETIERQFKNRVLGSYREKILGAYSRLLFVEKVNLSTKQLGEGGVLSGRIIEERTSNLEVAKASFEAACEEAGFQTRQDRARAKAALEQAERLVQISREHLRTLVGSKLDSDAGGKGAAEGVADLEEGETTTATLPAATVAGGAVRAGGVPAGNAAGVAGPAGGSTPAGAGVPSGGGEALSSLVLRTPFDGLVEDIFVARGERVKAGDRLFVVADTRTLWVRAQIHERQWTTVEVAEGQEVRVNVPGAADHDTTARVNHVGATVEAESRSVPLVAELENDDAHYKPGMFVWVDLPQGVERETLAVPAASVMRHAGESFVFVPDGPDRFRRVAVRTGVEGGGFIEVKDGLVAGQKVVSRGAFLLKSELLLEQDEEPSTEADAAAAPGQG